MAGRRDRVLCSLNQLRAGLPLIATWQLSGMVTIKTPGKFKHINTAEYGIDILGTEWQYIRVRCCMDALVLLFSQDRSKKAEICLGVNTNSISKLKACRNCVLFSSKFHRYLSCVEKRPFWISWIGGTFKLGRGHYVGEGAILTSSEREMTFMPSSMVFISGFGIGYWDIEDNPSNCAYFKHKANDKRISRPVFHTLSTRSSLGCVASCQRLRMCKSANYKGTDKRCILYTDTPRPKDLIDEDEWKVFIKV
ncbi:uncharacterized protein [Haliotis cracherodii]|uniref:uncharacterized protein n=1 Tax=Haliotis cracherodii TaxID=6455 RepID=UPI0039E8CF9D